MLLLMRMRSIFLTLALFFVALPAAAFYAEEVYLERNRDIKVIEEPTAKQQFFGELVGWPHTFTMLIKEKTFFTTTLSIPDIERLENNVNFILVKEVTRGVEEVVRIPAGKSEWLPEKESWSGEKNRRGPTFEAELEPGVYIFEVSTPDNIGKYVLEVGTGEYKDSGYFERLGMLVDVKRFHESWLITLLFVPTVYMPLMVIVLGVALVVVYRQRHNRKKESAIVDS